MINIVYIANMENAQPLSNRRMRSLAREGKRLGIHLEPETWAAIDLIAKHRQMKWQQWANGVLDGAPDYAGRAGAIRAAATQDLMDVLASSNGTFTPPINTENPMLRLVTPVSRADLLKELATTTIDYSADLGAFVLHAGKRAMGGFALFIENKMIDQLSIVICSDE